MRWLALLLALLLAFPMVPAQAPQASLVRDYWVDVDGAPAHGLVAVPADGEPRLLVVILHGYGHTAESHRGHLQALAERGALAVAMDFRGTGFPLRAGADDTKAAIADLLAAYPSVESSVLYSVSMGAAAAALLVPELPGVFDTWVINEGLSMLHETWAGATALRPSGNPTAVRAVEDIERETGGTPAEKPEAYAARSAALRALEMEGLSSVYLFHGLNDGLVPYNQGREMVAALRAAGIAADFTTVVRGERGAEGTSLTGYTPLGGLGFAGHGSESNDTHTLTKLSFAFLYDLVEGKAAPAADREMVTDHELGTLP